MSPRKITSREENSFAVKILVRKSKKFTIGEFGCRYKLYKYVQMIQMNGSILKVIATEFNIKFIEFNFFRNINSNSA